MSLHDLYLLSPELCVAGLGALLLVLDLFVARKGALAALAAIGLAPPLALSILLWFDLGDAGVMENTGLLSDVLVVDRFALFFKFLFLGVAAAVVLVSLDYARRFDRYRTEFYALLLFSVSGMMLLASSVELITLYISLELTALPVAALAAFNRDGRSAEAGMKFLILSGISSAVLLYGMVLVYGFTGATTLDDIAARIGQIGLTDSEPFGSYALLLGIVLIVAGFGFKITAVPFQMWAPDVYEGSPTPVTAFLSVASKAAGFAIVLRVFYVAFPMDIVSIEWSALFAVLAALSMTVGNFAAIAQSNIKRMLAYSTIAHAGYLLVGLAAAAARTPNGEDPIGPSGLLFYLAGYAVMNMAAFSAVIAISDRIGSDRIDDYAGMSKRAPYLAAVLAFALVSLTGVPPTVGFMVKVYMFGAAINHGLAWLAVFGVVTSVVSAYYYVRVIKVMYLSTPPTEERLVSGLPLRLAVLVATAAVLFFGVYPAPLLEFARSAAEVLLTVS